MAIYEISSVRKTIHVESVEAAPQAKQTSADPVREEKKGSWISSLIARLFFVALLVLDVGWGCYALIMLFLSSIGSMLSFGRVQFFQKMQSKFWLSIKRSLVCALALFTAIFSPAFGIMIACTYFLMYDKTGIEEVVPESLQDQFRDFFSAPEK